MKRGDSPTNVFELSSWRLRLDELVDEAYPRTRAVREYLHAHPEPSGEEFATTEYLRTQFAPERFDVRTGPGGRGLIVDPIGGRGGPCIALRADMDALRIQDEKSVAYRSQRDGVMHACGHDGHSAMVLAAAHALEEAGRRGGLPWPVPWRAIFQPAEETNRGAVELIADGVLNNVAAILGVHLDPSRAVGTAAVRAGAFTADCVEVGIRVVGRGGHAARPHESQDPIATAAQLISSIYLFVSRATDSHDPVVVTIGKIHGGDTPNAIPGEVRMRGTLRTFSGVARNRTMNHLRQLCRGLALSSDTTVDVEFIEGPPSVVNDGGLTNLLRSEAIGLLGAERVAELAQPSMGGEDFANYLTHVPGAMFRLGCGPPEGNGPSLHSPLFDLAPESLAAGAKVLARAAVAWAGPDGGKEVH